MRTLIHAAVSVALIAASATPAAAARLTADAQFAQLTKGLVPGKPVDCINLFPNAESRTIKGMIAYRDGRSWYVNRFSGGCPQLDENALYIHRGFNNQACRGDIVDVKDSGSNIPRGSCILDSFTPYKPAH